MPLMTRTIEKLQRQKVMTHSRSVFNVLNTEASTGTSAGLCNWRAPRFTSDSYSLIIYSASLGAEPRGASLCCSLRAKHQSKGRMSFTGGKLTEWQKSVVCDCSSDMAQESRRISCSASEKASSYINFGQKQDLQCAVLCCHYRDRAYSTGKAMCEQLKDSIPRQMFEIAVQAAIGSKVIARETWVQSALRLNGFVTKVWDHICSI